MLAITHLVYTLNDYNRYRLSRVAAAGVRVPAGISKGPVAAGDAELLGEFVDCLRAFGLPESDAVVRSGWTICWPARMRTAVGEMSMSLTSTSGITLHGPRSTGFGTTPGRADGLAGGGARGIGVGRATMFGP